MVLKTSHKWIIVVLAILAVAGLAYWFYKSIPRSQGGGAGPSETTTTNPGLLEEASNFFGGNWIKNIGSIFGGGKPKVDPCATVTCNPSKPGFDMNDLYDNCCA